MERQNDIAMETARVLQGHDQVEEVFYPSLGVCPSRSVVIGQMTGLCGMVAFLVMGGFERIRTMLPKLQLSRRAVNFGSGETLVGLPKTTSHAELSEEEWRSLEMSEGLIRHSAGIEDSQDLVTDLEIAQRDSTSSDQESCPRRSVAANSGASSTTKTDRFGQSARDDDLLACKLRSRTALLIPQLIEWRRYLYSIPELASQEHAADTLVAVRLREVGGYEPREEVGRTGVITDLQVGDAPKIQLRADADGISATDAHSGVCASQNDGVMFACGHDGSMATPLGAATLLADLVSERRSDINVRLLARLSEKAAGLDRITGALCTIDERMLAEVDAGLALHIEPSQGLGLVRLGSGFLMAGVYAFVGVICGVGGHGTAPEDTVGLLWLLPSVSSVIYGIVGRRISPLDSAVVSLCHVIGGDAGHAIPNGVMLGGTIRSFRQEARERLCYELEAAFAIVRNLGVEVDLDIRAESHPVCNDEAVRAKLLTSIASLEVGESIPNGRYGLMGQDFAESVERVSSVKVMLGGVRHRLLSVQLSLFRVWV